MSLLFHVNHDMLNAFLNETSILKDNDAEFVPFMFLVSSPSIICQSTACQRHLVADRSS